MEETKRNLWMGANDSRECSFAGVNRLQVEEGKDDGVCLYQACAKPRVREEGAVKVRNVIPIWTGLFEHCPRGRYRLFDQMWEPISAPNVWHMATSIENVKQMINNR